MDDDSLPPFFFHQSSVINIDGEALAYLFGHYHERSPKLTYERLDWNKHVSLSIANNTFERHYHMTPESFNKRTNINQNGVPAVTDQLLRNLSLALACDIWEVTPLRRCSTFLDWAWPQRAPRSSIFLTLSIGLCPLHQRWTKKDSWPLDAEVVRTRYFQRLRRCNWWMVVLHKLSESWQSSSLLQWSLPETPGEYPGRRRC